MLTIYGGLRGAGLEDDGLEDDGRKRFAAIGLSHPNEERGNDFPEVMDISDLRRAARRVFGHEVDFVREKMNNARIFDRLSILDARLNGLVGFGWDKPLVLKTKKYYARLDPSFKLGAVIGKPLPADALREAGDVAVDKLGNKAADAKARISFFTKVGNANPQADYHGYITRPSDVGRHLKLQRKSVAKSVHLPNPGAWRKQPDHTSFKARLVAQVRL